MVMTLIIHFVIWRLKMKVDYTSVSYKIKELVDKKLVFLLKLGIWNNFKKARR